MIIRKCKIEEAYIADELLTKLIRDEKQYDDNIDETFTVNSFYKNYVNKDNHCLLFCIFDEKIVGYIYGFIEESDLASTCKISKLDALYVLEDYRHLKAGTLLIESFKEWSKEKNATIIEVNVCAKNESGINLYKNANFKTTKLTMNLEINCDQND